MIDSKDKFFKTRIVARGEHSNHAHILIGDVLDIKPAKTNAGDDTIEIHVPSEGQEDYKARVEALERMYSKIEELGHLDDSDPERMKLVSKIGQEYEQEVKDLTRCTVLRHLMETDYLGGNQTWTKEHLDIVLPPGEVAYYAPQFDYHPLTETIERTRD